jgi:hypothetical protein
MTNAKELTRLLADVARAAAEHRETWLKCQVEYHQGRAADVAMRISIMDYRKAISRLFKAVLGRNPEQHELEVIDPAFEVKS